MVVVLCVVELVLVPLLLSQVLNALQSISIFQFQSYALLVTKFLWILLICDRFNFQIQHFSGLVGLHVDITKAEH